MSLSTNDVSTGTGSPEPYYTQTVTIARIEQPAPDVPDWMDFSILVALEVGQDFQPELTIGGALKRGPEGFAESWGGAFKVPELFKVADVEFELGTDEKIPQQALQEIIGKKVESLRFVAKRKPDGRLTYYTYDRFAPAGDDEGLVFKFESDVTDGWVKNYNPSLLEKKGQSSDVGLPEESEDPFALDAPF